MPSGDEWAMNANIISILIRIIYPVRLVSLSDGAKKCITNRIVPKKGNRGTIIAALVTAHATGRSTHWGPLAGSSPRLADQCLVPL